MTTYDLNNWENYKDAIKLGMTDGDAVRAICAEYVARRHNQETELYDLRTERGESCDENGRPITDEPPLCVLANLDAARQVKVALRNRVTLVKTLIDWNYVDPDDLARCVIGDGIIEQDDQLPETFTETDDDGDPRDFDKDRKLFIETVLWAVSDKENGQNPDYLTIRTTDPLEIEGDEINDVIQEYSIHTYGSGTSLRVEFGTYYSDGSRTVDLFFSVTKNQWFEILPDGTLAPREDDTPDLPYINAKESWCTAEELDDEQEAEYLARLEEEE